VINRVTKVLLELGNVLTNWATIILSGMTVLHGAAKCKLWERDIQTCICLNPWRYSSANSKLT
jgi:hypothetical protein